LLSLLWLYLVLSVGKKVEVQPLDISTSGPFFWLDISETVQMGESADPVGRRGCLFDADQCIAMDWSDRRLMRLGWKLKHS